MDRREFVKLAGLSVAALGLPIVAEEVTSIIYIMNDSRVVGFADSFDETAGHVNKMILNKIPVRHGARAGFVNPEIIPLHFVIAEMPGTEAAVADKAADQNELTDVVFTRTIRQMKIGAYKTKHIENKMTVYTGVSLVKYSYSNA